MKTPNYDFLEKCTKQELITAIRNAGWIRQAFRFSDILFTRWQVKSEELRTRNKKHTAFLHTIDGKAQDDLARQFNSETDNKKRLEVLEKMKPYHDKMAKFRKEYEAIRKEEKKLDTLYDSIDIQRKKERD